jgi:hypothetical protein
MPRTSKAPKNETFTFRLGPDLKAALTQAAADEHKQPGELMRDLLEAHIARKQRRAFEDEARRQCLAINARARNPDSDEAAVMRALGEHLDADDFGDEWKA